MFFTPRCFWCVYSVDDPSSEVTYPWVTPTHPPSQLFCNAMDPDIPDSKHGIIHNHLRLDVNCENTLYRHPSLEGPVLHPCKYPGLLLAPVSRLSPRGQYTSRQSGPGCRLQSDSTSDVLCADREERLLRGPAAWGGKLGSWKLRRAIKLVTQQRVTGGRANVQSMECWQIPKQPPWILNIVCPWASAVWAYCGGSRETGPGSTGLWPLKHWLADPRIFRKRQLQSSKVRESTWEFCWSQMIFYHHQRMVSNHSKCGCCFMQHDGRSDAGIERICVASTCCTWHWLGDGRNKGPVLLA